MTSRRFAFTLADVIRENARSLPDVEALVCGADRLTYRTLDERVNRTAAVLMGHGLAPGETAVWVGLSCHRAIETLLACAKAGAVFAPVNWRQSADELAWAIGQLVPRVLVVSPAPELAAVVETCVAAAPDAAVVVVDDEFERALAAAPGDDVCLDTDDELPVLELFTAAFTGRPRGALLTHKGIVVQNLVMAAMHQVGGFGEVYLASGPMFHIGVLLKLFANLHLGGKSVIVPRVDAEAVCRAIDDEQCTSAFLFTPTIGELVELNRDGRFDLSSLSVVPARPPEPVAEEWYAMTSCRPPEGAGVTGYGQTETLGMVTYEDRAPRGKGVFGRPSPVVALRVLDEAGNEVPDGDVGELAVRGPQLMARYHDGAFEPDGWHRTNDLGRREVDGTVSFLGPKLDLIKTGMENVYPAEVESVLRAHPGIRDACVIGVADPVWGQSVRAVVEPDGDAALDEGEVVAFVRSRIASYKKPKSVVVVAALPRSGPVVDRDEVKRRWSG